MCALRYESEYFNNFDTSVFFNRPASQHEKEIFTDNAYKQYTLRTLQPYIADAYTEMPPMEKITTSDIQPTDLKTHNPSIKKVDCYFLCNEYPAILQIEKDLLFLQKKNVRKALAYLYDVLETNFIESRYDFCDSFYKSIEHKINQYEIPILVSLLSISLRWKSVLSSREIFYFKVEQYIRNVVTEEQASEILEGLEN